MLRGIGRTAAWVVSGVALILSAAPCDAAAVGGIRGLVTDHTGAPLAGVTVTVRDAARGIDHGGAVSDPRGLWTVTGLPPGGGYAVQCSLPGFATVVLTGSEVQAGTITQLTVVLSPEKALREQVRVRAEPPVVALQETTTQSRYSNEFIDALPILGRNYQDVLTLAPGVSDVDGDGNPNIHGARDTDVVTLVDGVSTTDPYTGKVGAQLNIESIQEIEVKTSGASAEYGRAQGGFTNILTKSGGNDFEGTFKFFWRGSALDGDGAGIDDASLHGGVGEKGLRDLTFNDYLPFVSLGGPIAKDHAWYFVTLESIHKEEPVNAVSQAFVTGLRETRAFGKATWQVNDALRLALSVNRDPQQFLNQGLNSLTREETGFTQSEGGTNLTLRSVSVLSPSVVVEGTLGWFESRPGVQPNLGADTNGNGILFSDDNHDGFHQAKERDSGNDWDNDGAWDVWEDTHIANGKIDQWEVPLVNGVFTEDVDGDGRLTPRFACEGAAREDRDCDGHLDNVVEDKNGNGRLDSDEDVDGDHRLDPGTEDRNGNGALDDTPFPATTYPYGTLRPTKADRDYLIDEKTAITSGPYYRTIDDTRSRTTVRGDMNVFVPDFAGAHDLRFGGILERESFHRTIDQNDITGLQPEVPPLCDPETGCIGGRPASVAVLLPTEQTAVGEASGASGAFYVQDSFRPRPNLNFGLGVRFEHEVARAPGWTFFDPRRERAVYDGLVTLSGAEIGQDDIQAGNRDGIHNQGILGDPMLRGGDSIGQFATDTVNSLRLDAVRHLTRHRSDLEYTLGGLVGLNPDLLVNGKLDPERLSQLGVTVQQPQEIEITNHNLAPRLAVSWDPASQGRTKLFGTWGRYYDKLFLSVLTGEQGPDVVARYYGIDADGIDVVTPPSGFYTATANHGIGLTYSESAPSIHQVDRSLKTPYSDEWTVGLEHEMAPEVSLALRFIHRDFRDQLQDSDINHQYLVNPLNGRPYDLFGVLYEVPGRPPAGTPRQVQLPDGKPDLFIENPFFNQVLRVENSNTASYNAIEVELRRRLARRWEMQGSYVYSRAQGDAEDYLSKVGNDPSVTESANGYLSFDQRHVVKLNASLFLPADWQMGFVTSWASGLPYSVISRFFAVDNTGYTQFRTLFGYSATANGTPQFVSLPRNSERNHAVLDLNASVRKNLVIGRNAAAISLEVSNLLNSDDLHIVTYAPTVRGGVDINGSGVVSPLALDATRRFGRRFQLGFQFSF
jgi:outer membrane receptor protein involved in Fe transport